MEALVVTLLVAIALLLALRLPKRGFVPATGSDWFVVFDIDAEAKVLALWFYPIVAFERADNQTRPITSRPDYTAELVASRPSKKVNESMWGLSMSYGRWLRDGAPFDENGNPAYSDTSSFEDTVYDYLLGDFKVRFATAIPVLYLGQVQSAVERKKREA